MNKNTTSIITTQESVLSINGSTDTNNLVISIPFKEATSNEKRFVQCFGADKARRSYLPVARPHPPTATPPKGAVQRSGLTATAAGRYQADVWPVVSFVPEHKN